MFVGLVSWDEYHTYFLKSNGYSEDYIKQHAENDHGGLSRELKGKGKLSY